MQWECILSMAIPLFLVVSFAQSARVETKDVQPVQRFEEVISGHLTDLNGSTNFASPKSHSSREATLATTIMLVLASGSSWPVSLPT